MALDQDLRNRFVTGVVLEFTGIVTIAIHYGLHTGGKTLWVAGGVLAVIGFAIQLSALLASRGRR